MDIYILMKLGMIFAWYFVIGAGIVLLIDAYIGWRVHRRFLKSSRDAQSSVDSRVVTKQKDVSKEKST